MDRQGLTRALNLSVCVRRRCSTQYGRDVTREYSDSRCMLLAAFISCRRKSAVTEDGLESKLAGCRRFLEIRPPIGECRLSSLFEHRPIYGWQRYLRPFCTLAASAFGALHNHAFTKRSVTTWGFAFRNITRRPRTLPPQNSLSRNSGCMNRAGSRCPSETKM